LIASPGGTNEEEDESGEEADSDVCDEDEREEEEEETEVGEVGVNSYDAERTLASRGTEDAKLMDSRFSSANFFNFVSISFCVKKRDIRRLKDCNKTKQVKR
jgi:hypothetical protein